MTELAPGTILAGKYRYERDLGEGGMGRVVAATHLVLRQPVAVKILTRTRSPDAARRFLREARLAFRITSPHVPRIFDAGQLDDGIPYIAMELLEGVDLSKLVKERGALGVEEACDYVRQACAGIGEAHALGIVHRDVKLANLFVVRTLRGPFVKVLDFGCAKAERTSATSVANPTEDGAWLGTPQCMAPEQLVSSRDVTPRADVWALGVVLYTLIAGVPPFDGKTLRVLYEQIQNQSPTPMTRALPAGLGAVIDRCLRKEPEERFADARALGVALAPFAKGQRGSRGMYFVLGGVALALVGVITSVLAFASNHDRAAEAASSASAASASASVSVTETASAPVSAAAVVASEAHATASVHAPAKPIASVSSEPPSADDLYKADKIARGSCAGAHFRECFKMTDDVCESAVREIDIECLRSNDRAECMAKKFRQRFDSVRDRSAACDDIK